MRFLLPLYLLCSSTLFAAQPASQIKIELIGTKSMIQLDASNLDKSLKAGHPSWLKPQDKRACYLQIFSQKLIDTQWQTYHFSFTAKKDGNVHLNLLGRYLLKKGTKTKNPIWTLYDNFTVQGAPLTNGDFEQTNEIDQLLNWKSKHPIITISDETSKQCIAIWHDRTAGQWLKVKANQTVTIRFDARGVTEDDINLIHTSMNQMGKLPDETKLETQARLLYQQLDQQITKAEKQNTNVESEKLTRHVADLFLNHWIAEDRANLDSKYMKWYKERYKNTGKAQWIGKTLPARQLKAIVTILKQANQNISNLLDGKLNRRPMQLVNFGDPAIQVKDGYFYKDNKPVFAADANWSTDQLPMQFLHYSWAITPYHVMDANGEIIPKNLNMRLSKLMEGKNQKRAVWMTLLLPDGIDKKYPGILISDGHPYCKFDIDHPAAKVIWEKFLAALCPRVKKVPNFFGYHLANEPHWTGKEKSSYFYANYHKFLQNKYQTINKLNAAWKTDHKSFNKINTVPIPQKRDSEINVQSAQWYDYCTFNQQRVTEFFKFMNDTIQKYHPGAQTYIKTSNSPTFLGSRTASRFFMKGRTPFADSKLGHSRHVNGINREALTNIMGINGCDTSLNYGADHVLRSKYNDTPYMYAFHWLEQSMSFDFMKSLAPDKLLLDDEWHVQSTVFFRRPTLPAQYMTASLWLAHMHGMGAHEIWHWGRSKHGRRLVKDFIDSLTMQPVTLNAYLTGMMQLNAYAPEVVALAQMSKTIQILWSESSAIMNTDYLDTNLIAYQAANFLGRAVGYVTENQLSKKNLTPDTQLLIIPNAKYVQDSTVKAIKQYLSNGGKVIVMGKESLTSSPDGTQTRPIQKWLDHSRVLKLEPDNPTKMHAIMQQTFSNDDSIVPLINGQAAYGVVCRSANYQDRNLLFVMNLMNHPIVIDSIRNVPQQVQSLLSKETQSTHQLKINPMEFRLYRF